jgi:hypothetical protein
MPKHSNSIFTPTTSGLYLFGGQDAAGTAQSELWILRLPKPRQKNRSIIDPYYAWELLLPGGMSPTPRYGHTTVLVTGYLIVVGGRNDKLFPSEGVIHLNEIIAFNIQFYRWENINLAGTPPEGRWGACAELVGSKLIIYGGMELSNYCSTDLCYLETNQEVVDDLIIGDNVKLRQERVLRRRAALRREVLKLVTKPRHKKLLG